MVEVALENPTPTRPAAEQVRIAPDLGNSGKQAFGGDQQSEAIVHANFGAAVVTPHAIEFQPRGEVVPYTDNGCMVTYGSKADKTFDQLQSEGTAALNKPTSPGAPGAKDATEQGTADKVVQNTLTLSKESAAQGGDEIAAIQGAFKGMDKEQTQRVIDSANQKLAGSGLRYGQTQDGALWLGYKKSDGTFEASEYMRPPECSMG
jgi:hypothetical protein